MLKYSDETYNIIGAAMNVHKTLGYGFLEEVYQEALEIELKKKGIPYEREKLINIQYKGIVLKKYYKADFVCNNHVVVELKAVSELTGEHKAQLLNYLKATGLRVGLLINFGQQSLKYERLIF